MRPTIIEYWLDIADKGDFERFNDLLVDEIVLFSPAKNTPLQGKSEVMTLLDCVREVIVNTHFKYVKEYYGPNAAVLEFETICEGISVNGIDMITWNDKNHITEIKVMIRPIKALHIVVELMGKALERKAAQ